MSLFNSAFSNSELTDFLEPISPLSNQEQKPERETKQKVDIQETGALQVGEARLISKNLKRGQYTIKIRSTNGRRLNARIMVQVRNNKTKKNKTDSDKNDLENTDPEQILYQRNVSVKTSFLSSSSFTIDNFSVHQNSVMKVKLSNPSSGHPVNFSVELNGHFFVKRLCHSQQIKSADKTPERENRQLRSQSHHSRSSSFGKSLTIPTPNAVDNQMYLNPNPDEKRQQRRLQELSISPNREARIPSSSVNHTPTSPPDQSRRLKVRWIPWEDGAVGRGGTSHVYMGVADDGRYIAIKQIHINDQVDSEKLQKEVEFLRRCRHPHIVRYLGSSVGNDAQGKRYLTIFLEFIQGGSVYDILKKVGALFEKVASSYTQQILYGLAYLHSQGIVHGDIKPSNVLVTHLQNTVKISDFGASRYLEDKVGETTQGTPLYMSPEIIQGEASSPQSDIWALGCTVLEMLTAQSPWSEHNFKDTFEAFRYIRTTTSPPHIPDYVSPPAVEFIKECCQLNPKDRPTAEHLLCHRFIQKHEEWLNTHEEWITQHQQQHHQITPVMQQNDDGGDELSNTISSLEFTEHSMNSTNWTQTTDTGVFENDQEPLTTPDTPDTPDTPNTPNTPNTPDTSDTPTETKPRSNTKVNSHTPMQQEAFLDLDENELELQPAAITPQKENEYISFTENAEPTALFPNENDNENEEEQGYRKGRNSYYENSGDSCCSDDESVAISTSFDDSDGSDMGFEVISQGEVAAAQCQEKREEPHHLISLFLRRNAQRQKQLSKSILGLSSDSCVQNMSFK
eukprot:gb/GECH01014611.1/.p1 GENE.gb/GECH01014611.1/~~gb/GECH01014611.1/.p1  ORF type:complete len:793 (+),score=166.24 gb/GECH01014611.1/:1-2379(+)